MTMERGQSEHFQAREFLILFLILFLIPLSAKPWPWSLRYCPCGDPHYLAALKSCLGYRFHALMILGTAGMVGVVEG
jgi:hypothetical protein